MSNIIFLNSDSIEIKNLKSSIKIFLKNKMHIKLSDFFGLVISIVEMVEKSANLSGDQKAAIVCEVFHLILVDEGNELYNLVKFPKESRPLLKNQLANLIEVIMKITKGTFFKKTNKNQIKLNKKDLINHVYSTIKKQVNNEIKTAKEYAFNYALFLACIMNMLEEYKYLTNKDKKDMALHISKLILKDTLGDGKEDDKLIDDIMEQTDDTIDLIKDLSKRKFDINNIEETIKNFDDVNFNEVIETCSCLCGIFKLCKKKAKS